MERDELPTDPMKCGSFITEGFPTNLSIALVTSTEGSKILYRFGDRVAEKTNGNSPYYRV